MEAIHSMCISKLAQPTGQQQVLRRRANEELAITPWLASSYSLSNIGDRVYVCVYSFGAGLCCCGCFFCKATQGVWSCMLESISLCVIEGAFVQCRVVTQ